MPSRVPVKNWMTGDPVVVSPGASALEVLDKMLERGIRHLPVLDEGRTVVGVVSFEDLRAALPFTVSRGSPLLPHERDEARDWSVADVMTHVPWTIGEDESLADAAQRMAQERIGCLPVVDSEERLAGVISETDVLHALATTLWSDELRERQGAGSELDALLETLRSERARIAARPRRPDAAATGRLEAIDRALERAARGHFGVCDGCGGSIPASRLRARPGATRCVRCTRQGRD